MTSHHDLVRTLDEGPAERWDDETRGSISFRTLFSGDQTPTSALTTGIAELEPGERFAAHRHEQAEVYLVLAGEGVVRVGDDEVGVRPETCLFLPGGEVHEVRNTGPGTLRIFYVLAADALDDIDYDFVGSGR